MTREEAKQLVPIIVAYANGKKIQVKNCFTNEWEDKKYDLEFNCSPDDYRIKPEPKTKKVPLTYEDFKNIPLFWIRRESTLDDHNLIARINNQYFYTGDYMYEWGDRIDLQWSTDRINWKPFYKEVDNND